MEFRQIPVDDVAFQLTPVATVRLAPDDIERRLGVTFEEGVDDFGKSDAVLLELGAGNQYLLIRYRHSPDLDTDVHGSVRAPNVRTLVQEFLRATDVRETELSWQRDENSWDGS